MRHRKMLGKLWLGGWAAGRLGSRCSALTINKGNVKTFCLCFARRPLSEGCVAFTLGVPIE
jgi:hypothetical protein